MVSRFCRWLLLSSVGSSFSAAKQLSAAKRRFVLSVRQDCPCSCCGGSFVRSSIGLFVVFVDTRIVTRQGIQTRQGCAMSWLYLSNPSMKKERRKEGNYSARLWVLCWGLWGAWTTCHVNAAVTKMCTSVSTDPFRNSWH